MVETLIATVLIMIVFGMGIATLGNVLEQTVKNNARFIDNELNRLEYLYQKISFKFLMSSKSKIGRLRSTKKVKQPNPSSFYRHKKRQFKKEKRQILD